jgi:HlyD family secretion protein
MDSGRLRKVLIFSLFLVLTATGGYFLYQQRPAGLPAGLASGNGRLEATEVDVATKIAGRLAELGPHEGDMVEAGAVVARLDADDLRAQLREQEAKVAQARKAVDETRAGVRKSQTDVALAGKTLKRSESLVDKGFISRSKLDTDQTGMEGAMAGMAQAQSRVAEADAAVAAAVAKAESLQATVNDTALKAPIPGVSSTGWPSRARCWRPAARR